MQIGDVAEREGISVKYLEQLIIPLKKADYIKSMRGPEGGHMLAKPPEDITVLEIVKLLEGGINLSPCIEEPNICDRSETCMSRSIWKTVTRAVLDELDSMTLSDVIRGHKDVQQLRGEEKCIQSG